jgi:hypothetical protein
MRNQSGAHVSSLSVCDNNANNPNRADLLGFTIIKERQIVRRAIASWIATQDSQKARVGSVGQRDTAKDTRRRAFVSKDVKTV